MISSYLPLFTSQSIVKCCQTFIDLSHIRQQWYHMCLQITFFKQNMWENQVSVANSHSFSTRCHHDLEMSYRNTSKRRYIKQTFEILKILAVNSMSSSLFAFSFWISSILKSGTLCSTVGRLKNQETRFPLSYVDEAWNLVANAWVKYEFPCYFILKLLWKFKFLKIKKVFSKSQSR